MTPPDVVLLVTVVLWIRDRYLRGEARHSLLLAEQRLRLLETATRLYMEAREADDRERDHGMAQAKRR